MKRWRWWLVVLLSGWGTGSDSAAADPPGDPGAEWLGAYAWVQTGEVLAASGQWPLALGSFLEARRQIEALVAAHPGFEPEIVAFRREKLALSIAEAEEKLTTDEHEVTMKYLDFIESLEAGEDQRYADDFEAAHATLAMAKALLEEIVAIKPEGFRDAVAPQFDRLDSSLTWLESQIDFQHRLTAPTRYIVDGSVDWGTTRFLKREDLPSGQPGIPGTSELFPPTPVAPAVSVGAVLPGGSAPAGPATPANPAGPTAPSSPRTGPGGPLSGPRFRMSTTAPSAVPPPPVEPPPAERP